MTALFVRNLVQKIYAAGKARRSSIAAMFAFAVATLVYSRTLMPGVAFMDTGEFQVVPYVLGIAHPTGYPLFSIGGKLFGMLLPIGKFAYRMNLMSSLCVALAAALLVVVAVRYQVAAVVACVASLGFAFSMNAWKAADHADPYTLTVLIGASLWMIAIKWAETGDRRWL